MLPTIMAILLKLTHSAGQMMKPTTGGIRFHTCFCGARTKQRRNAAAIYSRECDQRAKVQHFGTKPIVQEKRSDTLASGIWRGL